MTKLMFPPSPTDQRWDEPVCVGFHWVGQSFDGCECCGRDITEHIGMDWIDPDAGPFSGGSKLLSFEELMKISPMFAHFVTPIGGGRPYRWECKP